MGSMTVCVRALSDIFGQQGTYLAASPIDASAFDGQEAQNACVNEQINPHQVLLVTFIFSAVSYYTVSGFF